MWPFFQCVIEHLRRITGPLTAKSAPVGVILNAGGSAQAIQGINIKTICELLMVMSNVFEHLTAASIR